MAVTTVVTPATRARCTGASRLVWCAPDPVRRLRCPLHPASGSGDAPVL